MMGEMHILLDTIDRWEHVLDISQVFQSPSQLQTQTLEQTQNKQPCTWSAETLSRCPVFNWQRFADETSDAQILIT